MKQEELIKFEEELTSRGYRKFTAALSSNETYGWFKGFNRDKDGEPAYQIEYRVWDWSPYRGNGTMLPDYGLDVLIISSDSERNDFLIGNPSRKTIEDIEKIGAEFVELLKKYELN